MEGYRRETFLDPIALAGSQRKNHQKNIVV
jgi:hypothetical protein